jgi:hypothetical protein
MRFFRNFSIQKVVVKKVFTELKIRKSLREQKFQFISYINMYKNEYSVYRRYTGKV